MAEKPEETRKTKDKWDKLQIVFHPLNGLLTAATVALLGYYTSSILRQNEGMETNMRVYSELASSREQADSALRKDMFISVIQTFLRPENDLEAKMLNLELLTYNFHESLNLKPLFAYMDRQISTQKDPLTQKNFVTRLSQVGRDIATRQLVLLQQVGAKFSRTVDFEMLKTAGILELMPEKLALKDGVEREFFLSVLSVNPQTREIRMEMGVRTPTDSSEIQIRRFSVGTYDFPMIDNTRLSRDQRAAVVITQSSDATAEITLVHFPGSYASLKEMASYDEVVEQLRALGRQPSR
jgi:hypothetical protein